MTRRAKISAVILGALAVYIGVYLFMTLHGHYEPNYAEPVYGPDTPNEYLLKAAEPKLWWPYSSYVSDAKPLLRSVVFRPLIYIDRTFWHTSEKPTSWHTSGNVITERRYREMWRYPIRGYFDEDTKESRYIETKVSEQAGPAYPPQGVGSADP